MNTSLPTWDLSDLYDSPTDPTITQDLGQAETEAKSFESLYRDNLTEDTSDATLAAAFETYASVISILQKLEVYAYLEHSTHTGDETYGAFFQNISTKSSNIKSHILFFEVALAKLPDKKVQELSTNNLFASYKHFLERKLEEKHHRLSELAENILQKKSLTGKYAFIRLQDQHITEQKIAMEADGKEQEYTVSSLLNLMYNPSRDVRKSASEHVAKIANRTLAQSTFTYNTLIQDYAIDASLRSFETVEAMRHLDNEVSEESVSALSDVLTSSYSIVQEYYRLKEQVLNIGQLYEYDRYAPITQNRKTYSFEEARDMVLDAFTAFHPTYGDTAKLFFEKRWIDFPSTPQKRHGAFCVYTTPDTHPYILLNYHGSSRDVSTLAHELGHGIHAYLARSQSILQFDWPITIAETASIFGEMVLFTYMMKHTQDPKEKLALMMEKVEGIFASTFRQISMYEFERQAHALREKEGELPSSKLNELWENQQRAVFGDSLTITGSEAPFWSLIPHIFHTPFYVYAYAFGELLTLSFFSMYEKSPETFPNQYLEFLSAAGSKSPKELVSIFNVDITDKEFWKKGLQEIASLVEQTKAQYEQTK